MQENKCLIDRRRSRRNLIIFEKISVCQLEYIQHYVSDLLHLIILLDLLSYKYTHKYTKSLSNMRILKQESQDTNYSKSDNWGMLDSNKSFFTPSKSQSQFLFHYFSLSKAVLSAAVVLTFLAHSNRTASLLSRPRLAQYDAAVKMISDEMLLLLLFILLMLLI